MYLLLVDLNLHWNSNLSLPAKQACHAKWSQILADKVVETSLDCMMMRCQSLQRPGLPNTPWCSVQPNDKI